jgi:carbonic anhydrase
MDIVKMISANEALHRIMEGNRRFVSQNQSTDNSSHRPELAGGQEPIAVILGCSDSRVPVEIIFDQGFGDLFVIRVAGNIVAPSQVGSVEFAVEQFGTPLVVVLGHSSCGAIKATLSAIQQQVNISSQNVHSIVNRVRPAIEGLLETDLRNNPESLIEHAVRANIRASANQLRHASPLIEGLIQHGKLLVVGAEYSLETGVVNFFDGMP